MSRFAFIACVVFAVTDARAADLVTLKRVPDGGMQPQAAVDGKGVVHLIYFKGDAKAGDAFYVKSTDAGATWSKAVRVNSEPEAVVAAGTIRGAQMALGKGGRVHVSWMGSSKMAPGGDHKQMPMLYARVNDAGDGFEPQRNVIAKAYGLDGGGSVAADEQGNVFVAWHAGDGRGEQFRRVYVARSTDDGKTFAAETAVDDGDSGVCGCCGMKAFADGGTLYVLYRGADAKVNRGMRLIAMKGTAPAKSAPLDGWKIDTCPMSSASITTGNRSTWLAWENNGRVFFAQTSSAPRASKPQPAETIGGGPGGQKHPALAIDKHGRMLLAWDEGTGWNRGGAVAWQAYDKERKPIDGEGGLKYGVPAFSLVAAFARPDGGFVVMY